MSTMTAPLWGSDRSDGLGLRALADPHAAITRGQYDRARATDREIVAIILERLGEPQRRSDPSARIYRFSQAELGVLVDLERASG